MSMNPDDINKKSLRLCVGVCVSIDSYVYIVGVFVMHDYVRFIAPIG